MSEYATISLPERSIQLTARKPRMGAYPLDAVIIESDWPGWEGLHNFHPAMLSDLKSVRLVKGPAGSGVRAGKRVREAAPGFQAGSTDRLRPIRSEVFHRYGAQRADNVTGRSIQIAPDVLERLPKAEHYRITCPATGCSFILARKEITAYPAGSEPDGTIKLSRYQRILLRLHPPMEFDELLHSTLPPEAREDIDAFYTSVDGGWPRLRSDDLTFPETQRIMRALNASEFFAICVTPFIQEAGTSLFDDSSARPPRPKTLRKAWYKTAQGYLGSRDHVLRVVRPYDIDESREAVRLSADSMTSLGIEETDFVRIRYGNRSIVARAMAITDEDRFRVNSYISQAETLDAVIGIPVGLRAKLGVPGINESVKVDRDVNYLMQKTLNVYVLSSLAWLLTLLQVVPTMGISIAWTVVVFFIALPLIIYAAAAPRRAQVRDGS